MKKAPIETAVGLFVILGLVCVGYLTIKLGKMDLVGDNYYPIYARFQSVSGLKTGAAVEMAGVRVGQVGKISLDEETRTAVVELRLRKGLSLSEDVIASVSTTGLIGDKLIKLSPGGSEETLNPGDIITETESAVDLEELISEFVFGKVK